MVKKSKPKELKQSTLPISPWSLIASLFPNLRLTEEMAELLSVSTDMSKQFWLDIQECYDKKNKALVSK